jgi:hypothetical protein
MANKSGGDAGDDIASSEDSMIKMLLSTGKCDILTKISTPAGVKGAKPKVFSVGRGRAKRSDTFSMQPTNLNHTIRV